MDKSSWDTPRKKPCFVECVSFSISNFHILTPSLLFNVVTTWQRPQSAFQHWKGGEGVWLSTKKMFVFFQLRKDANRKRLFCSNVSTLLSVIIDEPPGLCSFYDWNRCQTTLICDIFTLFSFLFWSQLDVWVSLMLTCLSSKLKVQVLIVHDRMPILGRYWRTGLEEDMPDRVQMLHWNTGRPDQAIEDLVREQSKRKVIFIIDCVLYN